MKIARMYSLSEANVKKLDLETNKSALIDQLLTEHYNKTKTLAERELELKQLEIISEAQHRAMKLKLEDFQK